MWYGREIPAVPSRGLKKEAANSSEIMLSAYQLNITQTIVIFGKKQKL
jgi:hypothetical protein